MYMIDNKKYKRKDASLELQNASLMRKSQKVQMQKEYLFLEIHNFWYVESRKSEECIV